MIKVVFQIQVARGALVCVSACLDSGLDEAAIRETVAEEPEADFLRIHRELERDAPMATRASGSDGFIARRVENRIKEVLKETKE